MLESRVLLGSAVRGYGYVSFGAQAIVYDKLGSEAICGQTTMTMVNHLLLLHTKSTVASIQKVPECTSNVSPPTIISLL